MLRSVSKKLSVRAVAPRGVRFASTKPTPPGKPGSKGFSAFTVGSVFLAGALIGSGYVTYRVGSSPPEFLFPPSSATKLVDLDSPLYGDTEKALAEINSLLGPEKITRSQGELDSHSDTYFQTEHAAPDERPVAVVFPESTEDVSAILRTCHKYRVPAVPFTGGTSLEAHFVPTRQGICIDLSRMNKIVALHQDDLDVVVQPAVGWQELGHYLAEYNLLFGPDPGPGACIGGMVGTSCSGTNAARYGTMKENVINLTVVLPDGQVVKTRKRPRKSAAGYNLNGLFIGSEGTLGIVTEATLRLNVKPKVEHVAVVSFPTLYDASRAVAGFVQHGLNLDAMELLDDDMMKYVNEAGQTTHKYAELPTLMLKIGGSSEQATKSLTQDVEKICSENKSNEFKFATTEDEKEELWNARKVALWSTISHGHDHISKDIQVWTTDVAVPISELSTQIQQTKDEIVKSGFQSSIVGHVGDGNYHALILYTKDQHAQVKELVDHMIERALAVDGTVTGEHGVGLGKKDFLEEELSKETLDLMRKIKLAIDPYRLLNPDKIFSIDPNKK